MNSPDFRERMTGRAAVAGVPLSDLVLDKLECYFRLLGRWNARMNLTALPLEQPSDDTLDRLLLEPVAAARLMPAGRIRWIDVGSGGGSPAIPMKICNAAARLTMVEAKARKAAFLREAVRVLELADVAVENVRFEELPRLEEDMGREIDLVSIRAVRLDDEIVKTAVLLLKPGASLLLFHSGSNAPAPFDRFSVGERVRLGTSSQSSELVLWRLR